MNQDFIRGFDKTALSHHHPHEATKEEIRAYNKLYDAVGDSMDAEAIRLISNPQERRLVESYLQKEFLQEQESLSKRDYVKPSKAGLGSAIMGAIPGAGLGAFSGGLLGTVIQKSKPTMEVLGRNGKTIYKPGNKAQTLGMIGGAALGGLFGAAGGKAWYNDVSEHRADTQNRNIKDSQTFMTLPEKTKRNAAKRHSSFTVDQHLEDALENLQAASKYEDEDEDEDDHRNPWEL